MRKETIQGNYDPDVVGFSAGRSWRTRPESRRQHVPVCSEAHAGNGGHVPPRVGGQAFRVRVPVMVSHLDFAGQHTQRPVIVQGERVMARVRSPVCSGYARTGMMMMMVMVMVMSWR